MIVDAVKAYNRWKP